MLKVKSVILSMLICVAQLPICAHNGDISIVSSQPKINPFNIFQWMSDHRTATAIGIASLATIGFFSARYLVHRYTTKKLAEEREQKEQLKNRLISTLNDVILGYFKDYTTFLSAHKKGKQKIDLKFKDVKTSALGLSLNIQPSNEEILISIVGEYKKSEKELLRFEGNALDITQKIFPKKRRFITDNSEKLLNGKVLLFQADNIKQWALEPKKSTLQDFLYQILHLPSKRQLFWKKQT